MKRVLKNVDGLLNLFLGIAFLLLVRFLLQTTTFVSFRIPTDSMQPALLPGDNILVNKWMMGARIFDIWEAAENKEVNIHRLPGVGKVKRGDVLVFHFPYPHRDDSLSMHLLKYYVKYYDVEKDLFIANANFYYREWHSDEEIERVEKHLIDSVDNVLIKDGTEEQNPILMFYRLRYDCLK